MLGEKAKRCLNICKTKKRDPQKLQRLFREQKRQVSAKWFPGLGGGGAPVKVLSEVLRSSFFPFFIALFGSSIRIRICHHLLFPRISYSHFTWLFMNFLFFKEGHYNILEIINSYKLTKIKKKITNWKKNKIVIYRRRKYYDLHTHAHPYRCFLFLRRLI